MGVKDFGEIMRRFREIEIPERFDMIVAIANGGIIPAAILGQRLGTGMNLLRINLRDENQRPKYDKPQLVAPVDFDFAGKRILLVDDRVKSGSTIIFAKGLLKEAALVRTFAVNGKADYALYDEGCFRFPWTL